MKTIIIILVVLAIVFAAYKWLTKKKVENGGQGGSEPTSSDNPDNVKPC